MPYTNTDPSLPFASGSDTSRDAAVRAVPIAGKQAQAVLNYIKSRGLTGATQKEIAAALDLGRPSVCARARELEQRGLISKTTGRRAGCTVYVSLARQWER